MVPELRGPWRREMRPRPRRQACLLGPGLRLETLRYFHADIIPFEQALDGGRGGHGSNETTFSGDASGRRGAARVGAHHHRAHDVGAALFGARRSDGDEVMPRDRDVGSACVTAAAVARSVDTVGVLRAGKPRRIDSDVLKGWTRCPW